MGFKILDGLFPSRSPFVCDHVEIGGNFVSCLVFEAGEYFFKMGYKALGVRTSLIKVLEHFGRR